MIGFVGHTKSFALSATTPVRIAPYSLSRKGVMVSNPDTLPLWVAIGMNPSDTDFFQLGANKKLILDVVVPATPIWAKGTGRAVVLDNQVGLEPFNIATQIFGLTEGAWFDFADITTMWQDADGLNPVKLSGQPVGLILGREKGFGPNTITSSSITIGTGATKEGTALLVDAPAATIAQSFGRVEGALAPIPGWAVLDVTVESTTGSYNLSAANFRTVPLNPGRNRYVIKGSAGATGNFAVVAAGGAGAYKAKITFHSCTRVLGKYLQAKVPTKRATFIRDRQLGYLQFTGDEEYTIPDSKTAFEFLQTRDGRSLVASAFLPSDVSPAIDRVLGVYGNNGLLSSNIGTCMAVDLRVMNGTKTRKYIGISTGRVLEPTLSQPWGGSAVVETGVPHVYGQYWTPSGASQIINRAWSDKTQMLNQTTIPRPGAATYDLHVGSVAPTVGNEREYRSTFIGRLYSLLIAKDVEEQAVNLAQQVLAADAGVPF